MKLEINEPCHEDWNKMKIGLMSRHCDVCEKSVMDFTTMSRAEIITYILSNPNDSVCGRMTRDQFDFRHEDIPILVKTLEKKQIHNPFLILALVCISLSACAQDTPTGTIQTPPPVREIKIGKVAADPIVTNHPEVPMVKGEITCEPRIEVIKMGEVEIIEEPLMGDIMIEEPIPVGGPDDTAIEDNRIFQFAEKMPEYPGGMEAFVAFVNANLSYPKYERDKGIQGNVYVRFVVHTNGTISDIEILRSLNGQKNIDKEVLRLMKAMPNWEPGENQGKKVNTYMTLPFTFRID